MTKDIDTIFKRKRNKNVNIGSMSTKVLSEIHCTSCFPSYFVIEYRKCLQNFEIEG